MRNLRLFVGFVFLGCVCLAPAYGADTAAPAADGGATSQPQADGGMKIYITAVSGLVQVRDAADQPWRAAAAQMEIAEGAELRTGPHSSVTCVIPPDQTFTLDRLGTVCVAEAAKHGNKITTDLIMKYGRTHYDIEAAGLEHEASIVSPSSTLAVRGTNVCSYDQPPFLPEATSYTGRALYTFHKSTVPVGTKGGSFANAQAGTDGAAQTALNQTVVDPRYAATLSASDQQLVSSEVARGAVLSYDPVAGIPVITGGRPAYDTELPSELPGSLNFVLRWTGNADLNIEVGVDKGDPLTNIANGFQQGEFLYPGYGYQNSASGGHIPFDDRGGPTGGEEFAYWAGSFPTGLYGIAAQSISGVATSFTLNVYANGVPLNMFYFNSSFSLIKSTQVTQVIQPQGVFGALVAVPDQPLLDQLVSDDPAGNPNPGIGPGSFGAAAVVALTNLVSAPAATPAPVVTPAAVPVTPVVAQPLRFLPSKEVAILHR
jgi:hypothetical protein